MNIFNIDPIIIFMTLFGVFIVFCIFFYVIHIVRKFKIRKSKKIIRDIRSKKHEHNPVLSPLHHSEWESQASFNPSVIMDDEGQIHLFYRAMGGDGVSRIGYATSLDGMNFKNRSQYPVFQPKLGFGSGEVSLRDEAHRYDINLHPSGGGWTGTEDPRTTRIGDKVYMTYTAFESWDNIRIGLTSISLKDLKKRTWKWKNPKLISPAKTKAKNWVIFPEKINGKYAILHSVSPKVLVDYTDSLNFIPKITSSKDHGGYGSVDKSREKYWDKIMKGAGAPPIMTDIGWLLLYHAINDNKYNVGVMILDQNDPTKILYRSPSPILSPDMHYENDGKPGIVYASGAVIKNNNLFIYYGGGDKHVCVAEINLKDLLNWLIKYGKV